MKQSIISEMSDNNGRLDAQKAVRLAADILKEITISGYIPFSSPAPSSTEVRIRDSIRADIRSMEGTLSLMFSLGGRHIEDGRLGFCEECRFFNPETNACMVTGAWTYEKNYHKCCEKKEVEV
jgi:hypothetical protein